MVKRTKINGGPKKRGTPRSKGNQKSLRSDVRFRPGDDPLECHGVFPTNEERLKYRDEMASRNYL